MDEVRLRDGEGKGRIAETFKSGRIVEFSLARLSGRDAAGIFHVELSWPRGTIAGGGICSREDLREANRREAGVFGEAVREG